MKAQPRKKSWKKIADVLSVGHEIAETFVYAGLALLIWRELFSKKGNVNKKNFTTKAVANLTAAEASVNSSGGSMGAILWTFLALALLGAIVGAFYWWWGRGQNEQDEG